MYVSVIDRSCLCAGFSCTGSSALVMSCQPRTVFTIFGRRCHPRRVRLPVITARIIHTRRRISHCRLRLSGRRRCHRILPGISRSILLFLARYRRRGRNRSRCRRNIGQVGRRSFGRLPVRIRHKRIQIQIAAPVLLYPVEIGCVQDPGRKELTVRAVTLIYLEGKIYVASFLFRHRAHHLNECRTDLGPVCAQKSVGILTSADVGIRRIESFG